MDQFKKGYSKESIQRHILNAQNNIDHAKAELGKIRQDESTVENCTHLCDEIRSRLQVVADAQEKEQLNKEFDTIAIFDKADNRASTLIQIISARRAWNEGMKVIESLNEGEPPAEEVIFGLQDAYNVLSKVVFIKERQVLLEQMKDVFLSWYSTRIVLTIQSDYPADELSAIKQKYDFLGRTKDFETVIRTYIKEQHKVDVRSVDSLPSIFVDIQNSLVSNYSRLCEVERWPEAVLDAPSEFIANALSDGLDSQWDEIKEKCTVAISNALENDASGASYLHMVLSLKQLISDLSAQADEDISITECIRKLGKRIFSTATKDFAKIASSFLRYHCSACSITGSVSACLDSIADCLTKLMEDSSYLIKLSCDVFDSLAIIFVVPALRSAYETLLSKLGSFSKNYLEKDSVKGGDVLRLISITGQMLKWFEQQRSELTDMLERYYSNAADALLYDELEEERQDFENKLLQTKTACGDVALSKLRADLRKLNKRFVHCGVDVLSRPMISQMREAMKTMRTQKQESVGPVTFDMPSFGTTQNEFVTATGVGLLSLAHQLSPHFNDANMAFALGAASKCEIEDVQTWWVEKCANAVQECFVVGIGNVEELNQSLGKQFAVDYVYLLDVFKDLGTPLTPGFSQLRIQFINRKFIDE
ncbi:hypothetical protein AB6A40_001841 [Gnathostoma spinigerum]|uniref:Conserved oligomeric Golgi complex subunit 7 n=1 Tax=Gnathostoma spinigerum TaxID=75299 RepID=A0ABD6E797_9BILA